MATIKIHVDCLGDYTIGSPPFHGTITIDLEDKAIKEGSYNYKKIESDLIDYFQEHYDTPRVFTETEWEKIRKEELKVGSFIV